MPSHAETRLLPYTPEQMYNLVIDVGRYPEFLPWCIACRIRERKEDLLVADLVIGFKMIRERFTSRVTMTRPSQIDVEYVEGPLKHLENAWRFEPEGSGCRIHFSVDFEFRSKVLQRLIGGLFHHAYMRMVSAFEARAHALYGKKMAQAAPRAAADLSDTQVPGR
ncbi:MAG: type II toxin-antitoxin system RatA family toxin [Pseudomonadota bacterium]